MQRLIEIGLIQGGQLMRTTHLPFNGTLSPTEQRMVEQAGAVGDFIPMLSTRSEEAA